ncbi:phage tail assembly protein [Pseudomonas poae]|uniref:Tail assembly chaperone E/41/14-like protein n=1 Tax=Pseudomonas poae TaxID=200451 RepID=A0A7Z1K167_9PSED|nr:phage tail assembly protein [Pseudomonas poae]PFG58888.1 tail assembly chaperone E/41/14-like protein [Pseudomonas poae]
MAKEIDKIPEWLTITVDSATIKLSKIVKVNQVDTDQLVMRSPTVREVRHATKACPDDEDQSEMILFASLTDAGANDLCELSVRDYKRLQAAYFRLVREDRV